MGSVTYVDNRLCGYFYLTLITLPGCVGQLLYTVILCLHCIVSTFDTDFVIFCVIMIALFCLCFFKNNLFLRDP
jgi:hypothetical protein